MEHRSCEAARLAVLCGQLSFVEWQSDCLNQNKAQETYFAALLQRIDDALATSSGLLMEFCELLRKQHGPGYVKALRLDCSHASAHEFLV